MVRSDSDNLRNMEHDPSTPDGQRGCDSGRHEQFTSPHTLTDKERMQGGWPLLDELEASGSNGPKHAYASTLPGQATKLAWGPDYGITLHRAEAPSHTLLVTFGAANSTLTEKGFGSDVAKMCGYDHIYVAQSERSNYQGLPLNTFYQKVQPLASQYTQVATYGSSLGAYSALYYGGSIGATIIASAPRNPIHPIINRARYRGMPYNHADLASVPASPIAPIILADPTMKIDVRFINEVVRPLYPRLRLVEVPFAGHAVLRALREAGVARKFLQTAVEENRVIDFQWGGPGSPIWHAERGRYLLDQEEWGESESHLLESLRISFDKGPARSLATLLVKTNRRADLDEFLVVAEKEIGELDFLPALVKKAIAP